RRRPACARSPGRSTPAGGARNSRDARRARRGRAPAAACARGHDRRPAAPLYRSPTALAAVARPRSGPRLLLTPSVVLSNNNCQAARKVKDLRKGHQGRAHLLPRAVALEARAEPPAIGRTTMTSKSQHKPARARAGVSRRTFAAGIGAAGVLAGASPFSVGRAQGAGLKVGVLLPRSGVQAGIGQDCQRGVEITAGILKDLGLPD